MTERRAKEAKRLIGILVRGWERSCYADHEDLESSIMYRLLRDERYYDPTRGKWDQWATRVIRRAAYDWLKKNRPRIPYEVCSLETLTGEDEHNVPDTVHDPIALAAYDIYLERENVACRLRELSQCLTPPQRRVLDAIQADPFAAEGELAATLGIAPKSVDNYRQNIRRKAIKVGVFA